MLAHEHICNLPRRYQSQEHTFDLRFRHGIQAVATQFRLARLSKGLVTRFSSAEDTDANEGFGNSRRDIAFFRTKDSRSGTSWCRSGTDFSLETLRDVYPFYIWGLNLDLSTRPLLLAKKKPYMEIAPTCSQPSLPQIPHRAPASENPRASRGVQPPFDVDWYVGMRGIHVATNRRGNAVRPVPPSLRSRRLLYISDLHPSGW